MRTARPRVVNGLGEFFLSIEADAKTGVIDMSAGPTEQATGVFPTRVIALGPDKSAYLFTIFKAPDMFDELFESQYRSLQRELDNIRAHFAVKKAGCAR